MSDRPTRYCTVNFMDGEQMTFSFAAVKDDEDPTLGKVVESLTVMNNLVFEVDGRLTIIPLANVRSVELSPAPRGLPDSIIKAKLR
jgi:hypothetical protein